MKKLVFALLVPVLALGIYDMKWFDLNHWKSPFYNDGRWGIDITQGTGVAARDAGQRLIPPLRRQPRPPARRRRDPGRRGTAPRCRR